MLKRAVFLTFCLMGAGAAQAEAPIAPLFIADPSPHVFKGKVYVYATNDEGNDGKYWNSTDWRLLTSKDLKSWTDHGPFLKASIFGWAGQVAKAWAPEAAYRDGKYYFYAPVGGKQIGVAVADKPEGPFKDALGQALIEAPRDANAGDEPIDPAVFVDDDGQAYLYFGTRVPKVVRLKADMIHTEGAIENLSLTGFPADDAKKKYGEAPFLHKRDGVYYFTFSSGWPGQILYATAKSPMGPFTYGGVVFDYLKISTNHQAIIDYKGQSLFFYHDSLMQGGSSFKRSIAFKSLEYTPDGAIKPIAP